MRIAVGEFKQESNTFSTIPTTIDQFRDFHLWFGTDVYRNLRDTNTEVAGFIDVCEERGHSIVPTMAGFAISGGPLPRDTYVELQLNLLDKLKAAHPFDAVLLALHGAMVADGEPDADGATLEAVRDLIGPQTPLVVSMDLHANVTRRCIEQADVIVGFRTCPHVDQRKTGQRAAGLLCDWMTGTIRPVMAYAKVPMIAPASTQVDFLDGPFKRLMAATAQIDSDEALAASVFTVQPWLDVPEMGFATVVVTDDDAERASNAACTLADRAWAERDAFMDIDLVPAREALDHALSCPEGPIVLSDLADGTGAGSSGDSTAVIAALVAINPSKPVLAYVYDPEVAIEAERIGVGNRIDTYVGGKRDNIYNRPIRFAGTVTFVQHAGFRFDGAGYTGVTMDMGLSAVIRRGKIHLLVTSKPVMTVDPALYRAVGLEPNAAHVVIVKSHIQFRAEYAEIARDIVLLDTPGMSSDHLERLNFRHVDRPLFPLDRSNAYTCRTIERRPSM